jgi:hypothetical protein
MTGLPGTQHDEQFQRVFAVLKEMLTAARETRPSIGFLTEAQPTPARPRSRIGHRRSIASPPDRSPGR